MLYTYDNVVAEAEKAGVLEKFLQEDHAAAQKNPEYGMSLVGLLKDANNATSETQRLIATDATNKLRNSYGVTGATSANVGSSFDGGTRLVAPEKAGPLASSDATTYQAVLDDIINQKEFSYDPAKDPTYAAYEEKYLREGRRASEDVLAKAAAMTGGRPSSYAVSAAQQTANQYAAALADMIPTLRQNALAEHNNELAAKYDILNALEAKQQTDYQKALEEENRKRLQVQDALSKYQALGYATPDVAEILGIPEGKPGTGNDTANGSLKNEILGLILNSGRKVGEAMIDPVGTAKGIVSGVGDKLNAFKDKLPWSTDGTESQTQPSTGEPTIGNKVGGEGKYTWIQIGGDKISMEALQREVEAGRIVGKYDAATNTVSYERVALPSGGR